MQPSEQINSKPMTPLQYGVIIICYILNMLDGMDVLVVSYAAPVLQDDWGVQPEVMGLVFSAGLVGMTLGALFLGPYTDVYGRRKMLIASVLIISSGLVLSALSQTVTQLAALRFYTGLGIGAMLASLASMAAEYAPENKRNLVVSLVYSGYPIGATLAGFISVWVLPTYGWQALFMGAGFLTAMMLPIMWFWLPESLEYLTKRQSADALSKINKVLRKMNFETIEQLPAIDNSQSPKPNVKALFSSGYAGSTIKLWSAFCFAFLTLYFLLSWIPTLAKESGLSLENATYSGALFNLGAVIGVSCIGVLSKKFRIQLLIMVFMFMGAALMNLIGFIDVSGTVLLLLLFILGITGHAGFIALYSVAARIYPTEIRSTGIGWAIGAGRIGGVLGPAIGGALIAMGVPPLFSFIIFSMPFVFAGIAIFLVDSERFVHNE